MRLEHQQRHHHEQNAREGQDAVPYGAHPALEFAYERGEIEYHAYLGYLRWLESGEAEAYPALRVALRDAYDGHQRQKPHGRREYEEAHPPVKLHWEQ